MTELMNFVRKVASSEATTILIQGESGTGKDLIAKAIHYESSRQQKPFVAINCSAIPETLMEAELFGHEKGAFTDAKQMKKGLFEAADGGTLFLDEIGELSPLLQAKLLRVLEDQVIRRVGGIRDMQVDVRVIAASNRDLEKAVRDGQFRQDLYYRLAIIAIFIPPLRDRKEDILPLVDFFIDRYNRRFKKSIRGITDETRRLILSHNWPGNVRELKNTIERGMILEDEPFLRPVYLPFSVGESGGRTVFERTSPADGGQTLPNGRTLPRLYIPEGGTSLEEVEHAMVELAMRQANGNQTHAAKLLDISRDALRYKLKEIRPDSRRRRRRPDHRGRRSVTSVQDGHSCPPPFELFSRQPAHYRSQKRRGRKSPPAIFCANHLRDKLKDYPAATRARPIASPPRGAVVFSTAARGHGDRVVPIRPIKAERHRLLPSPVARTLQLKYGAVVERTALRGGPIDHTVRAEHHASWQLGVGRFPEFVKHALLPSPAALGEPIHDARA